VTINPHYEAVKRQLTRQPKTWLVTGCAGFIGSHLVEHLLLLGQKVVGLDNFATGSQKNLNLVRQAVGQKAWKRFHFIRGDITRLNDCYKAFGIEMPKVGRGQGAVGGKLKSTTNRALLTAHSVDIVLHQAGLGSVPRSIEDPLRTHNTNVTGTLNLLVAAKHAGVRRFVYAASSSTYGDSRDLPKKEEKIGEALSPYAVSKHADELYAKVFGRCYGMETFGLRYFNVFGPRQDPKGAYAAVIPRWIGETLTGRRNVIYGDGKTSRDFCHVDNVVQANLLAAAAKSPGAYNQIYNVACGEATSLKKLHSLIQTGFQNGAGSGQWIVGSRRRVEPHRPRHTANSLPKKILSPRFLPERQGDVRYSLASIAKARRLLGYRPIVKISSGLDLTVRAFVEGNQ